MAKSYISIDNLSKLVICKGDNYHEPISLQVREGDNIATVELNNEMMDNLAYRLCLYYWQRTHRYTFTPHGFVGPDFNDPQERPWVTVDRTKPKASPLDQLVEKVETPQPRVRVRTRPAS